MNCADSGRPHEQDLLRSRTATARLCNWIAWHVPHHIVGISCAFLTTKPTENSRISCAGWWQT